MTQNIQTRVGFSKLDVPLRNHGGGVTMGVALKYAPPLLPAVSNIPYARVTIEQNDPQHYEPTSEAH